jgi:hypothetical protein
MDGIRSGKSAKSSRIDKRWIRRARVDWGTDSRVLRLMLLSITAALTSSPPPYSIFRVAPALPVAPIGLRRAGRVLVISFSDRPRRRSVSSTPRLGGSSEIADLPRFVSCLVVPPSTFGDVMNRIRFPFAALALLLTLAACDRPNPVQPSTSSVFESEVSKDIVPTSYQHHYWTTHGGLRQYLTITDPHGGTYHIAAEYDANGRLRDLRTLVNGALVGHDRLTWSGDQIQQHFVTTADGDFVHLDATFRLQAFGDRNGGYFPCSSPDGQVWEQASGGCGKHFRNYAKESGKLLGTLMLAGAASTSTGGIATVGSFIIVAGQAIDWYDSMRELDRCVKAPSAGEPPIQVEGNRI